MTSDLPTIYLRIEAKYKKKLKYIARAEGRSLNMQMRQIVVEYIRSFEKKYGKIDTSKFMEEE